MALFEPEYNVLLVAARQSIADGHPQVAVVAAQMACEVYFEQLFVELLELNGLRHLADAIDNLIPSYNLANDKVRRLYAALTGDQIHLTPFWPDYKIMVALRNKAVHAGGKVTKEQARVACRTAEQLIRHLREKILNPSAA